MEAGDENRTRPSHPLREQITTDLGERRTEPNWEAHGDPDFGSGMVTGTSEDSTKNQS
jgi:hypothetical protein